MSAESCPATLQRVVDGDTVIMDVLTASSLVFREQHWRIGGRYRLARINAPETSTAEGKVAAVALANFCSKRPATGWTLTTAKQDPYGRYIAEVVTPDGINLSDWMVAEGYAGTVVYKLREDGRLTPVTALGLGAADRARFIANPNG